MHVKKCGKYCAIIAISRHEKTNKKNQKRSRNLDSVLPVVARVTIVRPAHCTPLTGSLSLSTILTLMLMSLMLFWHSLLNMSVYRGCCLSAMLFYSVVQSAYCAADVGDEAFAAGNLVNIILIWLFSRV